MTTMTINKGGTLKAAMLAKTAGRKAMLKAQGHVGAAASKLAANDVTAKLTLEYRVTATLQHAKKRVRKSNPELIKKLANAIAVNGFLVPILVSGDIVVDGHARLEAAQGMDLPEVPVIDISHLSVAQCELVKIANNRTAELAIWDMDALRDSIIEIESNGFDLTATGFSIPELDVIKLDPLPEMASELDDLPAVEDVAVSQLGDCWQLGKHRLLCGSSLDASSYDVLLGTEQVEMVLTDPPYNVAIAGNVSGLGKKKHGEFVQATGEMTEEEFRTFLSTFCGCTQARMAPAAVAMMFMDWRHISDLIGAGTEAGFTLINMVVWDKMRGGMGGLYRSAHEMVAIFCNGDSKPAINNVKLGSNGRDRTNVWNYPGATTPGSSAAKALALHPTPKPVEMLVDAMLDVSNGGGIVLDPFMGSGSTIIAGETGNRAVRGIELDPKYVDCAIRRWAAWPARRRC